MFPHKPLLFHLIQHILSLEVFVSLRTQKAPVSQGLFSFDSSFILVISTVLNNICWMNKEIKSICDSDTPPQMCYSFFCNAQDLCKNTLALLGLSLPFSLMLIIMWSILCQTHLNIQYWKELLLEFSYYPILAHSYR